MSCIYSESKSDVTAPRPEKFYSKKQMKLTDGAVSNCSASLKCFKVKVFPSSSSSGPGRCIEDCLDRNPGFFPAAPFANWCCDDARRKGHVISNKIKSFDYEFGCTAVLAGYLQREKICSEMPIYFSITNLFFKLISYRTLRTKEDYSL